jgi:glyoxylase-like metal-dependent hydrolase (beta-lactamase superfamily II)
MAGKGYYWSTAYLIDGLLIDTGCAHSAGELIHTLADEELVCIINTHMHEDHIGANGSLQEKRHGLEIYAHPIALPVLDDPRKMQPLQLYRRVIWGWPRRSKGKSVQDGELIQTKHFVFQVIATPGHSPDHICLYEPNQGWLFTGDLFVGGRDRALREDYKIWQIITSLKKVSELTLSTLYPGCANVRDNPRDALANKIEYLEKMGEKVLALRQKGMSVNAIANRLFGGPMWVEFVTSGHFSRRHLVNSYLEVNA